MSICETVCMCFLRVDWIGKSPFPRFPFPVTHTPCQSQSHSVFRSHFNWKLSAWQKWNASAERVESLGIGESNRRLLQWFRTTPHSALHTTATRSKDSRTLCQCHWCFAAHSSVFSLVMEFINISLCGPVKVEEGGAAEERQALGSQRVCGRL